MTKSEVMQHKKEPMKKDQKQTKLPSIVGRYKAPPKCVTKEIESCNEVRKFTEYRNGLVKKVTELTANNTLPDENKRKYFIDSIKTSKDINTLLFETALIKKVDSVDGLPKLLLTVYCKWVEAYI
jgi:hypothetical protein